MYDAMVQIFLKNITVFLDAMQVLLARLSKNPILKKVEEKIPHS